MNEIHNINDFPVVTRQQKLSICSKFKFEYAHRLTMDYESACRNIHGHSAIVEVSLTSQDINENAMIIDFVEFKKIIQGFLDTEFDHTLIFNSKDPLVDYMLKAPICLKIKILNDVDPTSETLSELICKHCFNMLSDKISISEIKVTFYETANNSASFVITEQIYK